MEHIRMVIDSHVLDEYEKHYFSIHPRAKKKPVAHPYHESINVWMIMKRAPMNALKQRWKDFIVWFVGEQGYSNLRIEKCGMSFSAYYPTHRRHDVDNSCPKFILGGLVESGFIVDDDSEHLTKLTMRCFVDAEHPRTVIDVYIRQNKKEDFQNGEE